MLSAPNGMKPKRLQSFMNKIEKIYTAMNEYLIPTANSAPILRFGVMPNSISIYNYIYIFSYIKIYCINAGVPVMLWNSKV